MSDQEEGGFLWEALISPVKRKREKTTKKDKKCAKQKNHNTIRTDDEKKKKKKKKKSKLTDALEKKKEKKKEKKRKLPVGSDHSFIFTQSCSCVSDPAAKTKPESPLPRSVERVNTDDHVQDKKNKRKKKVVWDLSDTGYIRVKRPKFGSSTPKQNHQSEEEAARNRESFTQVTESTTTNAPQDDDSQYNSQDLFITQKTFRSSPPEISDKGVFVSTPSPDAQRAGGSNIHLLQHKKVKEPQSIKTVRIEEEEEEDLTQLNPKRETLSFQKQMAVKAKFMEERKVSGAVRVKPGVVNPYLDEPVVLSSSESKPDACSPGRRSQNSAALKANNSTQTENFFTAELCSYLSFCQQRKETLTSESWKPLDLSLPQRVRRNLVRCVVSVTQIRGDEANRKTSPLPDKMKDAAEKKESSRRPCCSPEMKDVEVKKEPPGRSRLSIRKTTPSPEAKSVNSSEDSEPPCSTGKPDLTQVRAVQTRLNESFYFKTKGGGRPLRPESPLMKLAQGREKKTRKSL